MNWDVTATDASFSPPNRSGYHFGKPPERFFWFHPRDQRRRASESWSARTTAGGEHRLRIDFDALDPAYPRNLELEASVTDVNRQAWSGAHEPGRRIRRALRSGFASKTACRPPARTSRSTRSSRTSTARRSRDDRSRCAVRASRARGAASETEETERDATTCDVTLGHRRGALRLPDEGRRTPSPERRSSPTSTAEAARPAPTCGCSAERRRSMPAFVGSRWTLCPTRRRTRAATRRACS